MADMGINIQTVIIILVIAVLFVFAGRHAIKFFGGSGGCHGGGGGKKAKKVKAVTVEDVDESHYPYRLELTVGGMSCDHCRETVENAVNGISGLWARVNLDTRKALVLGKEEIDQDAVESAIEDAGYYVIRQPKQA